MPFPLTLYIFNALRTLAKRILLLQSKWVTKNPTLAVQMGSYEGNGHLLSKAHLNLLDTSPNSQVVHFRLQKPVVESFFLFMGPTIELGASYLI